MFWLRNKKINFLFHTHLTKGWNGQFIPFAENFYCNNKRWRSPSVCLHCLPLYSSAKSKCLPNRVNRQCSHSASMCPSEHSPFKLFSASREFWHLLITFVNSLDPDQPWQNVGPDLDPKCWHSDSVPERSFWKSWFCKKSAEDNKSMKITQHAKI